MRQAAHLATSASVGTVPVKKSGQRFSAAFRLFFTKCPGEGCKKNSSQRRCTGARHNTRQKKASAPQASRPPPCSRSRSRGCNRPELRPVLDPCALELHQQPRQQGRLRESENISPSRRGLSAHQGCNPNLRQVRWRVEKHGQGERCSRVFEIPRIMIVQHTAKRQGEAGNGSHTATSHNQRAHRILISSLSRASWSMSGFMEWRL